MVYLGHCFFFLAKPLLGCLSIDSNVKRLLFTRETKKKSTPPVYYRELDTSRFRKLW